MTETAVTVGDRAKATTERIGRIGRQLIQWWTPLRIAGAAALVLAFLIGTVGYLNERELLYLTETAKQILKYLSANVSTELASIAITMLFVDALYQHRETEREKKRLVLQMGSPDNAFAREAVRALRSHGWLHDGSLKRASLGGANLQSADLGDANLQEANLVNANLQGAFLADANLQETFLGGAKLQETELRRANLQEASLFGANLQRAFLADANLQGAYLRDANLRGADLRRANLQEVWLEDARYDNATKWPEGFTPPPEAVNVDAEREQNGL